MLYLIRDLSDLPSDVGIIEADGSRSSDGRAGYLSYGPYVSLPPGRYFGGFHVKSTGAPDPSQTLTVDVAIRAGEVTIAALCIAAMDILKDIAGLIGLEFRVEAPSDNVEVRLYTTAGLEVNVSHLKIFRVED